MPTSRKTSTAYCPTCARTVTLTFWQNENDPGDSGMVRDCSHGGFVYTYVTIG